LSKYSHIHRCFVDIEQLKWSRINVDGSPHKHAFIRDGDEKFAINVEVKRSNETKMIALISSGLKDLLVLKSTGSAFENFIRDKHTTLAEVNDRVFSTSVEYMYTFPPIQLDDNGLAGVEPTMEFDQARNLAREITIQIFAADESASVQATLFKMGQKFIAGTKYVQTISYSLPNKHYIPVNMKHMGIENVTPSQAEVFTPVADPSGLITATIARAES